VEQVYRAGQVDPEYQKVLEAAGPHEAQLGDRKVRKDEILEIKDRLLYHKRRLWIPENKTLIKTILESEHDSKVAGQIGQDKNIELIRQNFWWPKMDECIIDFVRSCAECQVNKSARHQPYGLLSTLELSYSLWQSIAIDFITDLPLLDGCDQLWVIVDRFTKMAHFLPLPKEDKTAKDLAIIFTR